MKKIVGITEPYWGELSEDRRLYWKYCSRAVAIASSFFITKTAIDYFDWILTALTAAFLIIIIETQRSYSKFSPKLRKASLRVGIALGSSGVTLLGAAFFVHAALIATFSVYINQVSVDMQHAQYAHTKYLTIVIFLMAAPIAIIRVARQLDIEEIIYRLPLRNLFKFLVRRPYKATTLAQFAYFEIMLLIVCCIYASAVATVAKIYLSFFSAI